MNDEDILYHYTSIFGLNSILQSGKVWASDCRYLNDKKELVHAVELFLSRLDEGSRPAIELAFDWHSFSRSHCVFSLSRSPKVLSQWRSYGDDGKGAAIGFKRRFLQGTAKKPSRFLLSCVYEDHETFVDELISSYQNEIDEIVELNKKEVAVNSFWQAIDEKPAALETLYSQILRIKNEAFIEEQEERLIINVSSREVKTRVSNNLIVPHVEHEVCEEDDKDFFWCIAPEIWFGPKSDQRNLESILAFKQQGWINGKGIFRYDCGYI